MLACCVAFFACWFLTEEPSGDHLFQTVDRRSEKIERYTSTARSSSRDDERDDVFGRRGVKVNYSE